MKQNHNEENVMHKLILFLIVMVISLVVVYKFFTAGIKEIIIDLRSKEDREKDELYEPTGDE
jgi:hypothetical protein